MQQVTIKQVKQGDFFRLSEKDNAPVWVRGYYCCTEKVYEVYIYDVTIHECFFLGNRKVFVDFEF